MSLVYRSRIQTSFFSEFLHKHKVLHWILTLHFLGDDDYDDDDYDDDEDDEASCLPFWDKPFVMTLLSGKNSARKLQMI